ncbi:MAG: 3-deoxy-manno-octulosonate cytidylyltransferase [Gemmatimonadetes bacterium]|nr:3-deoxy-manno-octulosonate cytidylyltransferase [Gemmatimonadota bacterium]MCA9763915.1 3-deoxy-manno-octulosonate cytidylyltransferase [Gemmatimonadota bacterium]MCB9505693.1 3-deoxy-manno-octulosonate cytidylyltransferase [Gemmatimonadales bacterium]HPF60770.1 3-deoxy-manno-octulosonate cytidylyltransferase [Gemmatimonadales bacterium]HRX19225.1 3-deoxy-manno-octulosonate cytidylyltransferase [Gemmatimonadales bacterium]
MPVLIVIPARLGSTRLPRKPLQLLAGAPLITRVAERARALPGIDHVVVATDAAEVADVVTPLGIEVVMTRSDHESGTDRVAAVVNREPFRGFDLIVNLQGDEPFLPAAAIQGAIDRVRRGDAIGTAAAPLDPARRDDPGVVKVVCNAQSRAMYFSRLPIPAVRDPADLPHGRWWQHLGVYAFQRDVLLRLAAMPPSHLERVERLEQLRALEAGFPIGVAFLDRPAAAGIDTPADLAAAEARWSDPAEALP